MCKTEIRGAVGINQRKSSAKANLGAKNEGRHTPTHLLLTHRLVLEQLDLQNLGFGAIKRGLQHSLCDGRVNIAYIAVK